MTTGQTITARRRARTGGTITSPSTDADELHRLETGNLHATTRVRSAEAIFEDRGSMRSFRQWPLATRLRFSTRLPRDHFVRVDTNDYSVNPDMSGVAPISPYHSGR